MLTFKQRCVEGFWDAVPALLMVTAQLAAFVATRMGALEPAAYALPWVLIYYFSLFAPRKAPYVVMFLLGLFQDIVYATTLGSSALVCMALRWLAGFEQRLLTRENFALVWGYFALLLGGLWLLQWVVLSLLAGEMLPLWMLVKRWMVAVALYPLFHHALYGLTQWLERRETTRLYR